MTRVGACAAVALFALLSWVQFPGHTWLEQDSQIYAPILLHLSDPAVLSNDFVARHPHVAFTLYDETARALRWASHLDFKWVLESEQLVFRAAGLWGIFLIATALGLSEAAALLVAAIWALGATIPGPAVLTIEYEPTPRAFAAPLLFLALGFVARGWQVWAGIAAAAAFLLHPPTVYPLWLLFVPLAIRRRRWRALTPLIAAAIALGIAAQFQSGVSESQEFFTRLSPEQEALQRMRASYNWISVWWQDLISQYLFLYAAAVLAYWRVARRAAPELKVFLWGLPAIGMLSMPISWLLLERLKWALIPQFQPMRALLFVTAMAVLLGACAGITAARGKRYAESAAWFILVYLIPVHPQMFAVPQARVAAAVCAFAFLAVLASRSSSRAATAAAAVLPFFAIPPFAHVLLHSRLHTPELRELSRWARQSTAPGAVFLFADSGKDLAPGIFRYEARRAVYVDWKGGGQANYFEEMGREWQDRWRKAMEPGFDPGHVERYRDLGINYLVLRADIRSPGGRTVYRNSRYLVISP